MEKSRRREQDLKELGSFFEVTDYTLVEILAGRGKLAKKVGEYKDDHKDPKIRKEKEVERMTMAADYAKEIGVDPHFVQAMICHVIAEACRTQIIQTDTKDAWKEKKLSVMPSEVWLKELDKMAASEWLAELKKNLLKLTEYVAPLYEAHFYSSSTPIPTRMYLDFEWSQILYKIEELRPHKRLNLALDLGCATGHLARRLSKHFNKVIGCDLSPHMLDIARKNSSDSATGKIDYMHVDIEEGIAGIPSECADLVTMSLGTASDVYDLRRVLTSIRRVLKPNGAFVLSFYNKAALMNNMFVPWPLSLPSKMNMEKKYLEVSIGDQTFPVFGRLYDARDIELTMKKAGLRTSKVLTFPTISSVLPNPVMRRQPGPSTLRSGDVLTALRTLDEKLSSELMGAYILVSGNKSRA